MKTQLRKNIISAINRPTNPNNTPEKFASIMAATSSIRREKIVQFINGSDDAITDKEAVMLDSLK